MSSNSNVTRIRQPVVPISDATPFSGDLFERRKLAERLTAALKVAAGGGVISIDAAWGAGKTWFAKNWRLELEQSGFNAVYIDAFALDYLEDPFLMIAGELVAHAGATPAQQSSMLATAGKLGRALLPMTGKLVTAVLAKHVVGDSGAEALGDAYDKAVDGAEDLIEKQIQKKLATIQEEEKTVKSFKVALSKLTAANKNPLVVVVDELDRCRPDFAVRTLERIKHLFDVENVIFVLMINRAQLCASIRGCYGAEIDADAYLRKFLLFSLQLPQHTLQHGFGRSYSRHTLREFGFPDTAHHHDFADLFGNLATALGLQFRDIERGLAMYALAQPVNNSSGMVAWFIAIKLWRPALFARMLNGDLSAHTAVADEVTSLKLDNNELWIVEPMIELHRGMASDFQPPPSPEVLKWVSGIFSHASPKRAVAIVLAKLDLNIA